VRIRNNGETAGKESPEVSSCCAATNVKQSINSTGTHPDSAADALLVSGGPRDYSRQHISPNSLDMQCKQLEAAGCLEWHKRIVKHCSAGQRRTSQSAPLLS